MSAHTRAAQGRGSAASLALSALFLLAFLLPPGGATGELPSLEALPSIRTGPVTLLHAPGDEALAGETAALAARLHARIDEELGLESRVELAVLLLTERLQALGYGPYAGEMPRWIAGAAWADRQFIVLRPNPGESSRDLEVVLAHELTHVILKGDYPGSGSWPLWFREGLAMKHSGGEGLRRGAVLSLAALRGRLIPLDRLWSTFPLGEAESHLAYAQSFSVISYLVSTHGREGFRGFLKALRAEGFEEAFSSSFGYGVGAMEGRWRRYVRRRYNWIPLITGGASFWSLTIGIFFVAVVARRRRSRLIEERWREEEG